MEESINKKQNKTRVDKSLIALGVMFSYMPYVCPLWTNDILGHFDKDVASRFKNIGDRLRKHFEQYYINKGAQGRTPIRTKAKTGTKSGTATVS